MRLSHIALFGAINDFLTSRSDAILRRFADQRISQDNNNTGREEAEEEQHLRLNDDEFSGFNVIVRLYGFLANDEEIAQTEEFIKGVSIVLKVEEILQENGVAHIESDEEIPALHRSSYSSSSSSFTAPPSLLKFVAPGLFLLSLDEEFFDDVSSVIAPSLLRLYLSSSSSPSSSSSSYPNSIFAVFMNLASFHPSPSIGNKLTSDLVNAFSGDFSIEDARAKNHDLRACYVATLVLKLVSQMPSTVLTVREYGTGKPVHLKIQA